MRDLYQQAKLTEGFFDEAEAIFLIEKVQQLNKEAKILEIGSYYGRSTLFILSAMKASQVLISLDTFSKMAGYKDSSHSFWSLVKTTNDNRHMILPMTISNAYEHLNNEKFDLCFIDGNHSFAGVTIDLSYCIMMSKINSFILCHDVSELFPGVKLAVSTFEKAGVLKKIGQVKTLALFEIKSRPSWILDPSVYRERKYGTQQRLKRQ